MTIEAKLDIKQIGVIAGNGVYPETFIAAARRAGVEQVAVAAFQGETEPKVEQMADVCEWLRVGQLGKMIKFFKKNAIDKAVMVGQIAPKNLFDFRPDVKTVMLLARLKEKNAETIFGAIAAELAADGIELLSATTFLDDSLATEGLIFGTQPSEQMLSDAEYGFHIAKTVSDMDIGQTVVVKEGTVLAVEAFEGTDAAVARGGQLGRGDAIMVKVSKPQQDMRFDVPVVGVKTIDNAATNGIKMIAVEVGKTLLLESVALAEACRRHKITLYGLGQKNHEQT